MERSKLKLTVIFLLVVLNLFLLGSVGCSTIRPRRMRPPPASRSCSTWKTTTSPWRRRWSPGDRPLHPGGGPDWAAPAPAGPPEEGLPADCEIQPARAAATLLMYVVQGLPALGVETVTIQSIEEGYRYSGEGDRAVLTPMWALTTDQGTFLLDCASGALTPME